MLEGSAKTLRERGTASAKGGSEEERKGEKERWGGVGEGTANVGSSEVNGEADDGGYDEGTAEGTAGGWARVCQRREAAAAASK